MLSNAFSLWFAVIALVSVAIFGLSIRLQWVYRVATIVLLFYVLYSAFRTLAFTFGWCC